MSCCFQDSGVENCWLGIDALQVKHCPASVAWYHSYLHIGFNDPQIGLYLLMYEEYPADPQYIGVSNRHWNSSKIDDGFMPLVSCFRAAMGYNSPRLSTLPLASQGLFVGHVQIDPWALDFCSSPCTSWYPRLIWLILAKWSRQNEVECSNHRKSMPPPRCLPLLLTQSFSIGSFTASKGRPLVYWLASYFSLRSNLMATSVARSNLQKLMGQDHKPQCLGKSSLILKPFLS